MNFIKYKRFEKKYVYEVNAYWDLQKKKSRQKSKYLDIVVDKKAGIFKKKEAKHDVEKLYIT